MFTICSTPRVYTVNVRLSTGYSLIKPKITSGVSQDEVTVGGR